jgi:hypothetical protein
MRTHRCQVALAVDRFVEDAPTAYDWLWPMGIGSLVAIRRDLRSAGELTEVVSRHFRIGMIEGIEWESHDHTKSSM